MLVFARLIIILFRIDMVFFKAFFHIKCFAKRIILNTIATPNRPAIRSRNVLNHVHYLDNPNVVIFYLILASSLYRLQTKDFQIRSTPNVAFIVKNNLFLALLCSS